MTPRQREEAELIRQQRREAQEKPGRGPRPWTEREIAMLRRLWEAGLPASDIAMHVKRTRMAVCVKASDMGLKPRKWKVPRD